MKIFWFIPTHGDGRYLETAEGGRHLDFDYLRQVAVAADSQGFYGSSGRGVPARTPGWLRRP